VGIKIFFVRQEYSFAITFYNMNVIAHSTQQIQFSGMLFLIFSAVYWGKNDYF